MGGGVRQMPVKTTFATWAVMSKTCPSVAKRLIVHRKHANYSGYKRFHKFSFLPQP